ncbi:Putative rapid ALkalinization Factor [Colletotrichum destructivum]|uniref:Rapid ALkalinization Factor n=1 Tax=Colletotrichum destructivum TaxID=34406 RepID=A0AAX4IJF9_9PEZI|nr:Putative rapid ALkalinization Factor [Colletotrichum destructivum]
MKYSLVITVAFVLLATASPVPSPESISNGAMGSGRIPCNGKNKANCVPGGSTGSANPPSSGCNQNNKCRGGSKLRRMVADEFAAEDNEPED